MDARQNAYTRIARVAYAASRAMRVAAGQEPGPVWDMLDPQHQEHFVNGARHVDRNRAVTCQDMHRAWVDRMALKGWVWGPAHDPVNKRHPCMLAWPDLAPAVRARDMLFRDIVLSMLPACAADEAIDDVRALMAQTAFTDDHLWLMMCLTEIWCETRIGRAPAGEHVRVPLTPAEMREAFLRLACIATLLAALPESAHAAFVPTEEVTS